MDQTGQRHIGLWELPGLCHVALHPNPQPQLWVPWERSLGLPCSVPGNQQTHSKLINERYLKYMTSPNFRLTQQMYQLFQVTGFLSSFGRMFLPIPSLSELCQPSNKATVNHVLVNDSGPHHCYEIRNKAFKSIERMRNRFARVWRSVWVTADTRSDHQISNKTMSSLRNIQDRIVKIVLRTYR